ncbi:hypothetical protein [Herpetosiphon giganteus]|uniref:hypothetical protein n=1 Tax=Herpetosiphon giganteus TaxID=2029754 RepID=UPI001956D299|nr:hypothetical protein [Herpetosiphon giganteus]MBM7846680.1 hypothetical protein [Herpetosiphon giganteus]
MASPNTAKERIAAIQRMLNDVVDGLDGNGFSWSAAQRDERVSLLEHVGITLRTKTQLNAMGYRLKHGAQPVGVARYKAPLHCYEEPLYILEYQCVAVPNASANPQKNKQPTDD